MRQVHAHTAPPIGERCRQRVLQSLIDGDRIIDAVKLLRETRGLSISEAKSEIDALKKQR